MRHETAAKFLGEEIICCWGCAAQCEQNPIVLSVFILAGRLRRVNGWGDCTHTDLPTSNYCISATACLHRSKPSWHEQIAPPSNTESPPPPRDTHTWPPAYRPSRDTTPARPAHSHQTTPCTSPTPLAGLVSPPTASQQSARAARWEKRKARPDAARR